MEKRIVVAANCQYLLNDQVCARLLERKGLIPLGHDIGFVTESTEIAVKFRSRGAICLCEDECNISRYKSMFRLRVQRESFAALVGEIKSAKNVVYVFEGSEQRATLIVHLDTKEEGCFVALQERHPTLRLTMHDLPPQSFTALTPGDIATAVYRHLASCDTDLFSVRTQVFLKTPHILTSLFSHVMALQSSDQINCISVLKVLSDNVRELLRTHIRKIPKNHNDAWFRWCSRKVSFVDGGMSRIVSLPGTEPSGIRVGIYSVTPGETNLIQREDWRAESFVIGDVIGDRTLISDSDFITDSKRIQEAARYILEPFSALRYLEQQEVKPSALLLHGPLQNSFETYDELKPCYIPGLSTGFLDSINLSQGEVESVVSNLFVDSRGRSFWNSCIPIYSWIQHRLFTADTPIAGVVERTRSRAFSCALLEKLVEDGVLPESTRRKIRSKLKKYEITDELLMGCVLDTGEYIEPIELQKNAVHRAHERWHPVISRMPAPKATMLKTSADNFPFRIEFNPACDGQMDDLMALIFHTALLLPKYAFPVGIDIADKYAKIPDWLSKGVSATLTASVLNKVLSTGDTRLLQQIRRLLAMSPRDFFFRPKA